MDRGDRLGAAKAAGDDGWAGVAALDAQALATWLETCPGVAAWLSVEHLNRPTSGITALRAWYEQWAERTEPAVPAELLTRGREQVTAALLEPRHPFAHVDARSATTSASR